MTGLWKYLSKTNTASILAILWTLIAGGAILLVLTGSISATEAVQTMVLQGIFGIVMYIIGFYHGGSMNGKKKEEMDIIGDMPEK